MNLAGTDFKGRWNMIHLPDPVVNVEANILGEVSVLQSAFYKSVGVSMP